MGFESVALPVAVDVIEEQIGFESVRLEVPLGGAARIPVGVMDQDRMDFGLVMSATRELVVREVASGLRALSMTGRFGRSSGGV